MTYLIAPRLRLGEACDADDPENGALLIRKAVLFLPTVEPDL